MNENNYCVIMAGGIGSRFWPISRRSKPKQFLDVLGTGKSFIRTTFERFANIIPLENILKAYFYVIDPTVENKQGNDSGTQYQTGVYYTDEADLPAINAAAEEVRQSQSVFKVEIKPLEVFYPAEEYHQKYLQML